jgi:hypothetical protein
MRPTEQPTAQRRLSGRGAIRVLVGVDSSRERALLHALQEGVPKLGGGFDILRAVTAPMLVERLANDGADAIIVGEGLFELTGQALEVLVRPGRPVLLVGTAPGGRAPDGVLQLPADTAAADVRAVLEAAVEGSRAELASALGRAGVALAARDSAGAMGSAVAHHARTGQVLVFVGPPRGAPGTTRVAIETGAALGTHARTLLIDAVQWEPAFAAALALNPARNVTAVAAAAPGTDPIRWTSAFDEWTQPFGDRSPHALVLAGVPTVHMRHRLSGEFLSELLRQASSGAFSFTVVDAGAEPAPDTFEAVCWRALVEGADRVLLVTAPDTVSVARACAARKRLGNAVDSERLAVVLNGFRKSEHDDPAEIGALLAVPIVAVIPRDERSCSRALRAQQSLLCQGRSPAAREFRRFAERIVATNRPPQRSWRRWLPGWVQRRERTGRQGRASRG